MSQLLQFYKSFQQARAPVTKAAPTFEDLTIDDNLTEYQRVVRYVKSTIGLQRLVHVKMLADVVATVGFNETVANIIPLLEPLSKDVEPVVKQQLVEQLKKISKSLCADGGEVGYKVVIDKILPITAHLLEDEKLEVRQSASMTLVEVSELIKPDDIGQHVLTIILRLAHEDDKEEMRMTASQLLNLLAECLGFDLCKQFVIPEVVSLAEDPGFRVRKSTALNFHSICKVGGEHELLERLMPAFVRLTKDEMYRVRRACAESLSEISKNVSEDIRLGVLVEIFLRLTQDPSKFVKQSILQQSGMFIATLPPRAVSETILSHFCSLISGPTGDMSIDAELKHICAYSFPAVLQVIGKERWNEVRDVYMNLAQSRSSSIKQTLAYSLHEIARILTDSRLVEEELVPIFEEMIQDVEVVQMGVIKHLALFLSMLPEPCRVSYLPLLHDILHSTNPFNWRLRQSLAVQLPELVLLPPKTDLFRTLFRLIMILLQDPVASVRIDSFKGVTSLINNLYELSKLSSLSAEDTHIKHTAKQNLDEVARSINSFNISDKYQLRQLWLELCSQLMRDLSIGLFENYFLAGIFKAVIDPVSNVRVALSFLLTGWNDRYELSPWEEQEQEQKEDLTHNYKENDNHELSSENKIRSPWHWLLRRRDIQACVERLSVDDHDVYLNMIKLKPMFPEINFAFISCRGHKIPPGGNDPIAMNYDENVGNEEGYIIKHDPNNNNQNTSTSIDDFGLIAIDRTHTDSIIHAKQQHEYDSRDHTSPQEDGAGLDDLLDSYVNNSVVNAANNALNDTMDNIDSMDNMDNNEELVNGIIDGEDDDDLYPRSSLPPPPPMLVDELPVDIMNDDDYDRNFENNVGLFRKSHDQDDDDDEEEEDDHK
eukprot:gene7407-10096_t